VERAKLWDQAERYKDMSAVMKKLVQQQLPLTSEERNMLGVAYGNAVGEKRNSWRVINNAIVDNERAVSHESDEDMQKRKRVLKVARECRDKIVKEMCDMCMELIHLVDEHLLADKTTNKNTSEAKTWYLKIKGDFYRYIAEVSSGDNKILVMHESRKAYAEGFDIARANLDPENPVRLGLALNFSVLNYEQLNLPERACQMAKQSFDIAMTRSDSMNDESSTILQMMENNLRLWNTCQENNNYSLTKPVKPSYDTISI